MYFIGITDQPIYIIYEFISKYLRHTVDSLDSLHKAWLLAAESCINKIIVNCVRTSWHDIVTCTCTLS